MRLPGDWQQAWQLRVYPAVQMRLTPFSMSLPVSPLDLLLVGLLVIAGVGLWRGGVRLGAVARGVRAAAVVGAVLWLVFQGTWGWHYQALTLEQRLVEPYDDAALPARAEHVARHAVAVLNTTHPLAHAVPWPAGAELTASTEVLLRRVLPEVDVQWHPVLSAPRRSVLDRYFRWAGIDGMTNPFGLDVILNTRLLDVERPAVLAHEWAHLSGFADESDASFVAWMAGVRGGPQHRYSAWLDVLPHLLRAVPAAERAAVIAELDEGPRADLRAIRQRTSDRFRAVSVVAWGVYDRFLKANRVVEGVARYDAVARLILRGADEETGALRHPLRSLDRAPGP